MVEPLNRVEENAAARQERHTGQSCEGSGEQVGRRTSLKSVVPMPSGLCVYSCSFVVQAWKSYAISLKNFLDLRRTDHVKARQCAQVSPQTTDYGSHGFHKKKEQVR